MFNLNAVRMNHPDSSLDLPEKNQVTAVYDSAPLELQRRPVLPQRPFHMSTAPTILSIAHYCKMIIVKVKKNQAKS